MEAFRSLLLTAMRHRWITIAVTLGLLRRLAAGPAAGAAPVLPGLGPAGAGRRPDPAAERLDLRHRPRGGQARRHAQGQSRRRQLEHLCRARRDPLLSAAQRAARQRLLRAGRGHRQGCCRAGAAACRRSRRNLPRTCRASFPASRRWSWARRSAGRCNIASAVPISARCGRSPCSSARFWARDNNLRRVNFDWMEPARKVRVEIDQDQARLLGLSSQALSAYLNTVMTGAPITQVRDDIYLVDIVDPRAGRAARFARHAAERCRCRCRTGAPCRWARSRASIMTRNIRWSGGATASRP